MREAHLYVSECYFEGSNMAVMKLDVGGMLSHTVSIDILLQHTC